MRHLLFRIVAWTGIAVSLSGCTVASLVPVAATPRYDVRQVAVIAGAGIPLALVGGTDRRVSDAIDATRRTKPMERVVLTVNFTEYRRPGSFGDRRAMARFKVTAADIETGRPVADGNFTVYALTDNARFAEESLAEEAASRIRFAFGLLQPSGQQLSMVPRAESQMPIDAKAYAPADEIPSLSLSARVANGPEIALERPAAEPAGPFDLQPAELAAAAPTVSVQLKRRRIVCPDTGASDCAGR